MTCASDHQADPSGRIVAPDQNMGIYATDPPNAIRAKIVVVTIGPATPARWHGRRRG